MIREVERVDAESNLSFVGVAHIRHAQREFAKYFDIERKECGKTPTVRCSHVVLQNVDLRVRQARPEIDDRADGELSRQGKRTPTHETMGHVRGQNARYIRTNHGCFERNKDLGQSIKIAS